MSVFSAALNKSAPANATSVGINSSTEVVMFDISHSKLSTSWPAADETSETPKMDRDEPDLHSASAISLSVSMTTSIDKQRTKVDNLSSSAPMTSSTAAVSDEMSSLTSSEEQPTIEQFETTPSSLYISSRSIIESSDMVSINQTSIQYELETFETTSASEQSQHSASNDAMWESSSPRQSDIEHTTQQYWTQEVTSTYQDTAHLDTTLEDFEDSSTTHLDTTHRSSIQIRAISPETTRQDSKSEYMTHEDPGSRESSTASFRMTSVHTTSLHYQTTAFITQTSAAVLTSDRQKKHRTAAGHSRDGDLSDEAIFTIVMAILGFIAMAVISITAILHCRRRSAVRIRSAVARRPSKSSWMKVNDNVPQSPGAGAAADQVLDVVNYSSEDITARVVNDDQAKRRSDSLKYVEYNTFEIM